MLPVLINSLPLSIVAFLILCAKDAILLKITLSRKGFDSSAGGYPSPHIVENGRLLSISIPEDDNNEIDTGKTYADLKFDEKQSYLDVMEELGLRNFKGKFVHLDPDIFGPTINDRDNGWRGTFGQSSASQSHLNNKGVRTW